MRTGLDWPWAVRFHLAECSQCRGRSAIPNGLGSTTGLADDNGDLTDTYHYDAFGGSRSGTGSSDQAFKFTGEQQDADVANDLYYLRARYYDPAVGRFWSQDPVMLLQRYPYEITDKYTARRGGAGA